jgi:hypothetical protein
MKNNTYAERMMIMCNLRFSQLKENEKKDFVNCISDAMDKYEVQCFNNWKNDINQQQEYIGYLTGNPYGLTVEMEVTKSNNGLIFKYTDPEDSITVAEDKKIKENYK